MLIHCHVAIINAYKMKRRFGEEEEEEGEGEEGAGEEERVGVLGGTLETVLLFLI